MVALTGVEPAVRQFSSVQLGLSGCRVSTVGVLGWAEMPPRSAAVLPRSCPGPAFRRTRPRARPRYARWRYGAKWGVRWRWMDSRRWHIPWIVETRNSDRTWE